MPFPIGINFYGTFETTAFVNNDGTLSFGATEGAITGSLFDIDTPLFAAFWADVDTRTGGRPAMNNVLWHVDAQRVVVTWHLVGYYNSNTDKLNSHQLIISERSDIAPGDFDVEYRYVQCEWTTGDANGGFGGLGGTEGTLGHRSGLAIGGNEWPGSGEPEVINRCSTSNVGIPGTWREQFRGGFPQ